MKRDKLSVRFIMVFAIYMLWIIFFTTGGKEFMIWNIFLAFIPYFLSVYLYNIYYNMYSENKKIIICLIIGVLWLLFYPNAPYMLTDLMHLAGERFYIYTNNGKSIVYSMNINMWNNFFTIVLGTFLGVYVGLVSLNKIHSIIYDILGKYKAFCAIIFINYLSGFAIFLGRFSRYNSWDLIFHPYNILKIFKEELNKNTIFFTVMFGTLSLIIYYLYYIGRTEEKF